MTAPWSRYEYQPSFILGFHGCDEQVGRRILLGEKPELLPSREPYDWLGHGIYFWEGNPSRALKWAKDKRYQNPFVLGAVLDLRHCLDLFDHGGLAQVKEAHDKFVKLDKGAVPENIGPKPDRPGRMLDCAVINALHTFRADNGAPPYDSVRSPFMEGKPLYKGAGFRAGNHIQICVRDIQCIKGYFRPSRD